MELTTYNYNTLNQGHLQTTSMAVEHQERGIAIGSHDWRRESLKDIGNEMPPVCMDFNLILIF